jgi:hypothetical protein
LLIGTAIAFFSGRLAKSTELIEKANGQKFMTKAPKIVLPPISDAKSDQPAPQGRIVHGYDSDELCREDFELDSPSIKGPTFLKQGSHRLKSLLTPCAWP